MAAMIQNDDEKQWMLPLLELRNRLDPPKTPDGDRALRDFRRMNGTVQLYPRPPDPRPLQTAGTRVVASPSTPRPMPYPRPRSRTSSTHRPHYASTNSRPFAVFGWSRSTKSRTACLASMKRRSENRIPGPRLDDNTVFGADEVRLLRELCGDDHLALRTRQGAISSTEKRHKNMLRRAGIFDAIERAFMRNFFANEEDAIDRARERIVTPSPRRAKLYSIQDRHDDS